jgi:hypothetical protein
VLIAPPPVRPVERGMAGSSLIAHVLVHKQDYHTPYYRQEMDSERLGWPISRTNMARWQYESGELFLRLSCTMWQEALAHRFLPGPRSRPRVLPARGAHRHSHLPAQVRPGPEPDILESGDFNHTYFPSTVGLITLLVMSGNFPAP